MDKMLRIPLECHRTYGAKPLATRWLVPMAMIVVAPVLGRLLSNGTLSKPLLLLTADPVAVLLSGISILLLAFYVALAFWQPVRSCWTLERAAGKVRLLRQLWLGKRLLHNRQVDLEPYTWLRVTSVAPQRVTLELGNSTYQMLELTTVWGGMFRALRVEARAAAIRDLCAVGAQVSAMTGITDRGFREMA